MSDKDYLERYGDKLADAIKYAKWVSSDREHEDRPGQSLATRDHEVIRKWAEERKAVPATVGGTEHDGHAGVLRFHFSGYGGERLQDIGWDDWFEAFDDRELVFLYQEHLKKGDQSNFFRLQNPHRNDS